MAKSRNIRGKSLMAKRDKQRRPGQNKQSEPESDKANIAELSAEVQQALKLLDSETADAIIGEQTEEYQALIRGTKAVMGMEWAAFKSLGLRQNGKSLQYAAQTLTITTTLVHYAYALGIRRGREEPGDG